MSHHSDDNMLVATTDSFWEPGNYKRTTKRIEDGYKLCCDTLNMVQERAEIEKNYAKSLKTWAKKYNEIIEKGPEYGTAEASLKGFCEEAERLADVHLKVRDDLTEEVMSKIKTWQKDNFHKNVLFIRERKEFEEAFKKVQKPWAKLLQKVEKCKQEYHAACKAEKSACNQERNASGDTSVSPDQVRKMQDRVQKLKEDVQKGREKYEAALNELNAYNPKYMEEMTSVFGRCQQMEGERLRFFRAILYSLQKVLNISENTELPLIYQEFKHTINNSDHEKDLRWWSNNHGVNMAMNWPVFEEYTEEFRDISKGKSKEGIPAGPITLINQRPVGEDLHDYSPGENKAKKPNVASKVITNDVSRDKTDSKGSKVAANSSNKPSEKAGSPNKTSPITNGTKTDTNPFEEEEWDEDGGEALVDNGEPGVPVRALYDYEATESDELSFKQGDLFEKLEDEDEQGWCKGRKDGRVGLYPANYVEAVLS